MNNVFVTLYFRSAGVKCVCPVREVCTKNQTNEFEIYFNGSKIYVYLLDFYAHFRIYTVVLVISYCVSHY